MARRGGVPPTVAAPEPYCTDTEGEFSQNEGETDADGAGRNRRAVVPYKQRNLSPPRGEGFEDGFRRLSIHASSPGLRRRQGDVAADECEDTGIHRHPIFQRADHAFRQWVRGRGNNKPAVLPHIGNAPNGRNMKDAPLVDLHIHIDHNNIGSLALGT